MRIRVKLGSILQSPTDGTALVSAIVEGLAVPSCQYNEHKGLPHSLLIDAPDTWDESRLSGARAEARVIAARFRDVPPPVVHSLEDRIAALESTIKETT